MYPIREKCMCVYLLNINTEKAKTEIHIKVNKSYRSTHLEVHIEVHIYYQRLTVATVVAFFCSSRQTSRKQNQVNVCVCVLCAASLFLLYSHTPMQVSTSSSEELNPSRITGRFN